MRMIARVWAVICASGSGGRRCGRPAVLPTRRAAASRRARTHLPDAFALHLARICSLQVSRHMLELYHVEATAATAALDAGGDDGDLQPMDVDGLLPRSWLPAHASPHVQAAWGCGPRQHFTSAFSKHASVVGFWAHIDHRQPPSPQLLASILPGSDGGLKIDPSAALDFFGADSPEEAMGTCRVAGMPDACSRHARPVFCS